MTTPNQKARERWLLEGFGAISGALPKVTVREAENPDFRFELPDHVLGIEIREVDKRTEPGSRSRRQGEGEADKLVQAARRLCEEQGVPPVCVWVTFEDTSSLQKQNRSRLSRELASLVSKRLPAFDTSVCLESDWRRSVLPDEIDRIRMFRTSSLAQHLWDTPEADFFQEDCVRDFQFAIDDKQERLPEYLRNCRECWLLLAAEGLRPSSYLAPDRRTRDHRYRFLFDKVFYFNFQESDWCELKPRWRFRRLRRLWWVLWWRCKWRVGRRPKNSLKLSCTRLACARRAPAG